VSCFGVEVLMKVVEGDVSDAERMPEPDLPSAPVAKVKKGQPRDPKWKPALAGSVNSP
jgi:hypothetical protein